MATVAPPGTWALPSPGGGDPALVRTLGRMAGDLYMVADGARHPRLSEGLAARGLAARPLWLEYDESGVQENGPWLCRLETPFSVEDALNVLGPGPQAVFWLWKAGEMALFRHLRHLNLVEIPLEEPPEEGPAHETVLFRHWDPEVLAPMLPLFDADQKARFFGVAEGVVFNSLDFGGLAAVSAPSPFRPPDPTRRLLRFSREQMDGLQEARAGAIDKDVVQFVIQEFPDRFQYEDAWSGPWFNSYTQLKQVHRIEGSEALHCLAVIALFRGNIESIFGPLDSLLSNAAFGENPDGRICKLAVVFQASMARLAFVK